MPRSRSSTRLVVSNIVSMLFVLESVAGHCGACPQHLTQSGSYWGVYMQEHSQVVILFNTCFSSEWRIFVPLKEWKLPLPRISWLKNFQFFFWLMVIWLISAFWPFSSYPLLYQTIDRLYIKPPRLLVGPKKCKGLAPLLAIPSFSFVTGFAFFSVQPPHQNPAKEIVERARCNDVKVLFRLTLAKSDWHVCTCSKSGLSGTSWKVHPHLLFRHFIYVSKVLHFHVDGPHDGLDDLKTGGADWLSISKWTEVDYSGSLQVRGVPSSP